ITSLLRTDRFGRELHFYTEVDSTNLIAQELARKGEGEGTVVVADAQTAGLGRAGKSWFSPPGVNLYLSVLLRPPVLAREATLLSLVGAVATTEAMRREGALAFIKWPNDVLIERRKVAGILAEADFRGEHIDFAVLGIGVNLNVSRAMLKKGLGKVAEGATSLKEAMGKELDRTRLAAALLSQLEAWYQRYLQGGRELILRAWLERSMMMGRRVEVKINGRTLAGIVWGLDEYGLLLLRTDTGRVETIATGEVRFLD
ncbi:MAG: biotin--[acetyl-CoA-carboxylase] ligase, partial [Candidatus Methylomirabilales bacterium]